MANKFLCVGTSAGAIMVIEIRGPGKFKHVADLAGGHGAPLFDITSDSVDTTVSARVFTIGPAR